MKRKTIIISSVLATILIGIGALALYAMGGDKNGFQKSDHDSASSQDEGAPLPLPKSGLAARQLARRAQNSPQQQTPASNSPQNYHGISLVAGVQPSNAVSFPQPQTTMSLSQPSNRSTQLPPPPTPPEGKKVELVPAESSMTSDLRSSDGLFSNIDEGQNELLTPPVSSTTDQTDTTSLIPPPPANIPKLSEQMEYDPSKQVQLDSISEKDSAPLDIQYDGASMKTSATSSVPPMVFPAPTSTIPPAASLPVNIAKAEPRRDLGASPNFTAPGVSSQEQLYLGTALPGPRQVEGAQTPQLVIEKRMPPEVPMNEPVTIKIVVRNSGVVRAKSVMLTDRIPKGTKLEDTAPRATITQHGELVWELGDLDANAEKTIEIRVMPIEEGEFGSTATATFSVETSARTLVTKPGLEMEVRTAEQSYLAGSDVIFEIVLTNPGTGLAENIVLEEYVPDGLYHPKGSKLSSPIGNLKPGESKHLKLTMQGVAPGEAVNHIVATALGGLEVENKTAVVILAPRLDIAIDGPKMRYLERKAVYQLTVGNSGSAPTRNVKLLTQLPEGVEFVSTDSNGVYDPSKHTVHWALEELPPQQSGEIELIAIPKKAGDYHITFSGVAEGDLHAEQRHEMSVQGIAALCFEVADLSDPVEIGRNAVYEIRVANQGTKSSLNVLVNVQLSEGMEFVEATGPVQYQISEGNIIFNNILELAPKDEQILKVKARCLQVGDHRIRVQVQSDDLQQPVTKEESTKVYGDE